MQSAHTSAGDGHHKTLGLCSINNDLPRNTNNCKLDSVSPVLYQLQPGKDSTDVKGEGWANKRRQITIIVLLAISSTSSAESISLFSPFYSKLAEDKGWSASVYGFVLGSNSFIMFLATPFIGKHVKSVGLKFAFTSGIFIIGTSGILSGFLHQLRPGAFFIFMSIALRIVHALGNAAVVTSSFAIMGTEFPNSVAKVFVNTGFTRFFIQVGYLTGPIIGGFLYKAGGYSLPFIVLGGFHYIIALLTMLFYPGYKHVASETTAMNKKGVTIRSIIWMPGVWIAFCSFIISTFTNGFLSVTLRAQLLHQFALDPAVVGLLFAMKDGIHGIVAPFWGYIADKTKFIKPFLVVCTLTSGLGILLIQPSKVTLEPALWIVVVGLIMTAIGTSGEQVIAILDALRHIIGEGNPDDPDLHGCLAGLWSSLCGLGKFLSRSLSGILVDCYGHSGATIMVSWLNLLLALVIIIFLYVKSNTFCIWNQEKTGENEPLLSAQRKLLLKTKSLEYQASQTYAIV